ncbi:YjfI family protein [Marinobacterium sp. D7]|uniref:DUF2170 family protein n=1 Tax=Marinobacterium ramblicola TaxID=2849041 RepID=UPI001C2D2603|nr:DUF2170 family protein [Marinobacterium ramblicola]MBV1787415.1 YjfI family protein [Marinobacterium ramblicola]
MALTLAELHSLLSAQDELTVMQEGDAVLISHEDGVDAFVTVEGDQILVESLLCKVDQVRDQNALNAQILRTHKTVFPLTTLGISTIGNDEYYAAFGALSAHSKPESVLIEVETLFLNIEGMLEFYGTYLA